MIKEIWKDIVGYEGLYQVSNYGKIKSLVGWNGHKYYKREKILKETIEKSSNNYYRCKITLKKDKKRKDFKVHQLVAKAFIPNPNNCKCVNHIDNNPLNNNVENLEWCTQEENVRWMVIQNRNSLITLEQELQIIKLYENGIKVNDIVKKYKIGSYTPIYRILKKHNIKPFQTGQHFKKYNIDKNELLQNFIKGKSNKQLALEYNVSSNLIAKYRQNLKKYIKREDDEVLISI